MTSPYIAAWSGVSVWQAHQIYAKAIRGFYLIKWRYIMGVKWLKDSSRSKHLT